MSEDREVMQWMMRRLKAEKPKVYEQHVRNLISHSPDWFKAGSESEADYWEWNYEMAQELGMDESPYYEYRRRVN